MRTMLLRAPRPATVAGSVQHGLSQWFKPSGG